MSLSYLLLSLGDTLFSEHWVALPRPISFILCPGSLGPAGACGCLPQAAGLNILPGMHKVLTLEPVLTLRSQAADG